MNKKMVACSGIGFGIDLWGINILAHYYYKREKIRSHTSKYAPDVSLYIQSLYPKLIFMELS